MEDLAFIDYVKTNREAFANKVKQISSLLGINPNWLMAVMYKESRVNHQAVNSNGGATGLIQFMPNTAIGLGTTTTALKSMTNLQQLDYVYKYFKPYVGKLKSYADLYLCTFFPAVVGMPDSTIIQSKNLSAQTVAKANSIIDLNKDGKITIAEFKEYCLKNIPEDVKKKL